jgi:N-acetylmuramoyl-L-alanine amidase
VPSTEGLHDDALRGRRRLPRAGVMVLIGTHLLAAIVGGLVVCRTPGGRAVQPVVHRWGPETLPDPRLTPSLDYDWARLPPPEFPIPSYARFLRGVVIVLDPGHGGMRPNRRRELVDPNRGPNGVREAEVNLTVALYLREFLESAGATVQLTRERDEYLQENVQRDLAARVHLANRVKADLFISIHHNAAANPQTNYSLVFFHDDGEERPASLCAARYLITGLNDALRLETHVDCAIRSDFVSHPEEGYAVLRQAEVPAVLVESSFHTNPEEADRLLDQIYNRREAYGLFLGLARWAQAGLPSAMVMRSEDGANAGVTLVQLDDGLIGRGLSGPKMRTIREHTLRVRVDGKPVEYTYLSAEKRLRLPFPPAALRGRTLFVDFENLFGQHVLHPELTVP